MLVGKYYLEPLADPLFLTRLIDNRTVYVLELGSEYETESRECANHIASMSEESEAGDVKLR